MKRRAGLLVSLLLLIRIVPAAAEDQVKLFKIVTPKDDVTVGLTSAEIAKLGSGTVLDDFAKALASQGQMTIWQYAVRKDVSGALQQAPLKRIAIFKSDTLRIEPYSTPLPVIAPEK